MARGDLAVVLGARGFRRLVAVRFTGQFCDGLFQAALATFVLFSPERQASATAIAASFAILYLPYSLVGPFVGVFLDRWSRRQVLFIGNLSRTLAVIAVAGITAAGNSAITLGIAVLVALGINRFILAGLSAALPHTVPERSLVTANAFAPTSGTLFAAAGGLAGVLLWRAAGADDTSSVIVLLISAAGFTSAGLLALRMPRASLGPDGALPKDTFREVVDGLRDGVRALWRARPAFRAVAVVTSQRVAFGVLTVLAILLLRNTLNSSNEPEKALNQLTLVVGATAIGWGIGAIITPQLTRWFGSVIWSASALAAAGLITPLASATTSLTGLIVGGGFLGLGGAAVKITADTFVQEFVSDDFRGRVFSIYDVAVNIGLVTGIVIAAFGSPISGQAPLLLLGVGVLLIGTAGWTVLARGR